MNLTLCVKKWPYLSSEASNEKSEGTLFNQLLILKTFSFLTRKDPMQIERDMADLSFSLSESTKKNLGKTLRNSKTTHRAGILKHFLIFA